MKIDIDNDLISYLIIEGEWERPETDAAPDAVAETLIHNDFPGVRIPISEIDGKGGLQKLFCLIYDQAVRVRENINWQEESDRDEAIDTIEHLWKPNMGDDRHIAYETLYQAVNEVGWESLPSPVLVRMAELQSAEHLRQLVATVANHLSSFAGSSKRHQRTQPVTHTMNPKQVTITAARAEAICGNLESLEQDHSDIVDGVLGANFRSLLVDIEAPELPPDSEEEYPAPEPEDPEIEAPEPCPDSLGDEDRAAWLEYNRNNEGEEILETMWLEFQEGRAQAAIETQLERWPFP